LVRVFDLIPGVARELTVREDYGGFDMCGKITVTKCNIIEEELEGPERSR
jgi:hypothetical protein